MCVAPPLWSKIVIIIIITPKPGTVPIVPYGVRTLWCEMLKEQKSIRDDPSSSFRSTIRASLTV